MKETAIRFEENGRLCAILAEPGNRSMNRLAVIFISAGLLPKSGPFRMYTDFARSLASLGFLTLRVDLSGNGDSLGALTAENADHTTVADTRAAMDELEARFGIERFVLFGLCSGAEAAHRTALVDHRVAGIVALDGFIARTWKYYFWHYLPRVFSARKWRDWLAGKLRTHFGSGDGSLAPDAAVEFWDDRYPTRQELAADHRKLCERGVRQLLVYSGGSRNCSYARQFHDAFRDVPCRDRVDTHFFHEADHTYVLREDRRALHQVISHWFRRHFLDESLAESASQAPARKPSRRSSRRGVPAVSYYRANPAATQRSEEI